jgi:hypothetical protein
MITRKTVLKALGNNPYLDMELAPEGYVYFIYDDVSKNIYETHSVMVEKLNHLDLDRWIETGKEFIAECEGK